MIDTDIEYNEYWEGFEVNRIHADRFELWEYLSSN